MRKEITEKEAGVGKFESLSIASITIVMHKGIVKKINKCNAKGIVKNVQLVQSAFDKKF